MSKQIEALKNIGMWFVVAAASLLAISVILVPIGWLQAHQEAKTYNRLTGAHATTWDALWVELRVQAEPLHD